MLVLLAQTSPSPAGLTLDTVRKRGHLICGVGEAMPGFAHADEKGKWSGLDVDFCSAVAAAVLGNKDLVKFRPLSTTDRFKALQDGSIDVLSRATTWTLSRDTEIGLRFVGTLFYDGQALLVRRSQGLTSVLELSGATVCVLAGTSNERGLAEFFRSRQMRYQAVSAPRWDELVDAYAAERCTLISSDLSVLALERESFASPGDHMLLPELISKEPLGPAVRQGDEEWLSIVRWTLMALIAAEELGVTSETAAELVASPSADVRNLLGGGNLGQGMGLPADWAFQIVKQVGNYGEVFARNVGKKSPLRLDRGLNDLWTRGGLMYSPPFR
jgi:general L-amino acid transport system substrate-binding protein